MSKLFLDSPLSSTEADIELIRQNYFFVSHYCLQDNKDGIKQNGVAMNKTARIIDFFREIGELEISEKTLGTDNSGIRRFLSKSIVTVLVLAPFLFSEIASATLSCAKGDLDLLTRAQFVNDQTQKMVEDGVLEPFEGKKTKLFELDVSFCIKKLKIEEYCKLTNEVFKSIPKNFEGIPITDKLLFLTLLGEQRMHCSK